MKLLNVFLLTAASVWAQAVETVPVVSQTVSRKLRLPGEILPYMKVPVLARVNGFLESIDVDRGSVIRKGQTIAKLSAPEQAAQIAEAQAKVEAPP